MGRWECSVAMLMESIFSAASVPKSRFTKSLVPNQRGLRMANVGFHTSLNRHIIGNQIARGGRLDAGQMVCMRSAVIVVGLALTPICLVCERIHRESALHFLCIRSASL